MIPYSFGLNEFASFHVRLYLKFDAIVSDMQGYRKFQLLFRRAREY